MRRFVLLVTLCTAFCACHHNTQLRVGIAETCGESRASVGRSYIDAVSRGGHIPVIIPNAPGSEKWLSEVDLLLLIGGDDIDPARYGEEMLPECGDLEPERDAFEYRLLDEAVRLRKPVMGICRGEQMINVYFGGTLYQDLPSQFDTTVCHRSSEGASHCIHIEPDSRLHGLLGLDTLTVNSFHHQAVKDLAPGFRVSAFSADGTVEAIESETLPIAGVQFHPERMLQDSASILLPLFTEPLRLTGRQ